MEGVDKMTIDPKEIAVLEEALQKFDDAYTNIVQAVRRCILVSQMTIAPPKQPPPKEFTGNPCPNCHGLFMVRTGTCMTCQACGFNTGCG